MLKYYAYLLHFGNVFTVWGYTVRVIKPPRDQANYKYMNAPPGYWTSTIVTKGINIRAIYILTQHIFERRFCGEYFINIVPSPTYFNFYE